MDWAELAETGPMWRIRARLVDRPGALAGLTRGLGERGANVLAVTVLPVADTPSNGEAGAGRVVDELVLRAPAAVSEGDLRLLVESVGVRCIGVTRASVQELVDPQTAVLQAAATAMSGRSSTYEALRLVLGADAVYPTGGETVDEDSAPVTVRLHTRGHRATITLQAGEQVLATRGWAPFTAGELARVPAMVALLQTAGRQPDLPLNVPSPSPVPIVVRVATPADAATVTVLHRRRMAALLFALHRAGVSRVPPGWAHRYISPPRGRTLLADAAGEVIGFVQLLAHPDGAHTAELSLLVEEKWQHLGVGTALLAAAHTIAQASGVKTLIGWPLTDPAAAQRIAARAGLVTAPRTESGLPAITLTATTQPPPNNVRVPVPAPLGAGGAVSTIW